MSGKFDSFVMFASMRTGSNFLEANLNTLPGVLCHGEIFNPQFVGWHKQFALFDMSLAERDADPATFLSRMREAPPEIPGFRYFPGHDPRVFDLVMADPGCAKIVLTRNPLEAYLSRKIADATGHWRMFDVRRRVSSLVRFDPAEFEAHLEALQAFHLQINGTLQATGQTAFWIDYDDLHDLDVLNGLAGWLGSEGRIGAVETKLKKQNPEPLLEKVENPEEMAEALARLDRFNLSRTPNFEPRRGPGVPSFSAAGPILHLPIPGGPEAVVDGWLAGIGPVARDFNQKSLRKWMRANPRHRAITVLRHPLARAWTALTAQVLPGHLDDLRTGFERTMQFKLPKPGTPLWPGEDRDVLLKFLRYAKMNLTGQTAVKVEPHVATQSAVLQGFAQLRTPDVILREERLASGLAFVAAEAGADCPPLAAQPPLALPCDAEIEAAARDAYKRDYISLGFDPYAAA